MVQNLQKPPLITPFHCWSRNRQSDIHTSHWRWERTRGLNYSLWLSVFHSGHNYFFHFFIQTADECLQGVTVWSMTWLLEVLLPVSSLHAQTADCWLQPYVEWTDMRVVSKSQQEKAYFPKCRIHEYISQETNSATPNETASESGCRSSMENY